MNSHFSTQCFKVRDCHGLLFDSSLLYLLDHSSQHPRCRDTFYFQRYDWKQVRVVFPRLRSVSRDIDPVLCSDVSCWGQRVGEGTLCRLEPFFSVVLHNSLVDPRYPCGWIVLVCSFQRSLQALPWYMGSVPILLPPAYANAIHSGPHGLQFWR